jgi:hypothetical protein
MYCPLCVSQIGPSEVISNSSTTLSFFKNDVINPQGQEMTCQFHWSCEVRALPLQIISLQ